MKNTSPSAPPEAEPPDWIVTARVAMLPTPRLVRAVAALPRSDRLLERNAYVVSAPVAVTPRLVLAVAAVTSLRLLLRKQYVVSAPVAVTPKLVRAPAAVPEPVPPLPRARAVPDQLLSLIDDNVARDPRPRLVRAVTALPKSDRLLDLRG